MAGQPLEEDFVRINVRYISIVDNINLAESTAASSVKSFSVRPAITGWKYSHLRRTSASSAVTALVLLAVYGGYFLATALACRRMAKQA